VAGVVLALGGMTAIVIAVQAQRSPPQPPASAAIPVEVTPSTPPTQTSPPGPSSAAPPFVASSTPTSTSPPDTPNSTPGSLSRHPTAPAVKGPVLARSTPVHLSIPAIGVQSDLKTIGLQPNGEITTPPLARDSHAYWLDVSPTPGQLGPSVILGHVDSAQWGPAVFFDLGKLRQRDRIEITLADHTVAVFEVTHVNEYSKAEFPTLSVYGNTDHAALRLMTCGGTFDSAQHSYESNIVVYADLVSSHHT
jgi:sortase (surface protein transpeptidase)